MNDICDFEITKMGCENLKQKKTLITIKFKQVKELAKEDKSKINKEELKKQTDSFIKDLQQFREDSQILANGLYIPEEVIELVDNNQQPFEYVQNLKNSLDSSYIKYSTKVQNFQLFKNCFEHEITNNY